jgi:transposase
MNSSDTIKLLLNLVEEHFGIRFAKQLFCVLLLVFGVEKNVIIEKLGVSHLSVKKYDALLQRSTIKDIFADHAYRRTSEMENYRTEIMAELETIRTRTLREAATVIEKISGLQRSHPQIWLFLKKTATNP